MSKFYQRNTRAAKLTWSKVREMRELYTTGEFSQADLGRRYGIGVIQAGRILRMECWKTNEPQPVSAAEIDASQQRLLDMLAAEGITPQVEGKGAAEKMAEAIQEKKNEAAQADLMLEGLKTNLPLSEEVAKKAKEFLG